MRTSKSSKSSKLEVLFNEISMRKLKVCYVIYKCLTYGRAVLPLKQVEETCRVQSPVALVNLALRSFPGYSS